MRDTDFGIIGIPEGRAQELLCLLGERFPSLRWAGQDRLPLDTPVHFICTADLRGLFIRPVRGYVTHATSADYRASGYEILYHDEVLRLLRGYNDD